MTKFFQNWLWVSALAFLFSFIVPLPAQAATSEPVMVKDINSDGDSWTTEQIVFNNELYFGADDGTHGNELWKSDGTAEGTVMVADINPGGDSYPSVFAVSSDTLYFTADDGTHGYELWKSDGTEEGTVMVKAIASTSWSSPLKLTVFNNEIYFGADDGTHGNELWKSDGTEEGTVMVKDIRSGINGSISGASQERFTVFNNELYFGADDGAHGSELWKTDGTTEGTVLVKDIRSGSGDSDPQYLIVFNNELYFGADGDASRRELWKTDGTQEGTVMVADINPSGGSIEPYNHNFMAVYKNNLYFKASDIGAYEDEETGENIDNYELWKTDGTEEGTVMVADINPSGGSSPRYLTVFNNELYFFATDIYSYDEETDEETSNYELWKTDGTEAGTVIVADINPSGGSDPSYLTVFNNELYFQADDGTHGHELWKISILEDEGGEDSADDSGSSDSSKSISSTLKKSSQASSPNVVPGWKHPVMAGPNFTGTHGFIPNINVTSDISRLASIFIDKTTHHDDLYIHHSDFNWMNILMFWNNPDEVKLPWTQGFNTVSEISKIEAKASFNGYPVYETDNPFIILLGYDKDKLGNIPTEQLKIAWFNEVTKKWDTIKGVYVYPDGKIATVTNKFGYFSVVYPRSWWGQ